MLEINSEGRKSLRVINETGRWRFHEDYGRRGEGIYDMTKFHRPKPALEDDADDQSYSSRPITEGHDQVNVISDNADSKVDENQNQADSTQMVGPTKQSPPVNIQNRIKDPSPPAKHSRAKNVDPKSSEPSRKIHKYSQIISLSDIESYPRFPSIQPNFYIIFRTFSSLVVLCTEYDAVSDMLSNMNIVGTKRTRGGGIRENRDTIQRNLYVCQMKKLTDSSDEPDGDRHRSGPPLEEPQPELHLPNHPHPLLPNTTATAPEPDLGFSLQEAECSNCPHCGKDTTPAPLDPGLELGPYFGHLPPISTSWSPEEYLEAVPDGTYTVLWMNNNQLPMWGHILCRASTQGDGILERVCVVMGPTEILAREGQLRWGAEWECFVLG